MGLDTFLIVRARGDVAYCPRDGSDPDPAEQAVIQHLAALGVDYELMPCDPDLADTGRFCEFYGVDPEDSANTIIVSSRTDPPQFVACVVLATTRLDVNKVVRKLLGVKKASFASGDETRDLTGMLIGGVTAFGLPADLILYIDSRVMERSSIIVGGGSRSCKIRCHPSALTAVATAQVIPDLAKLPSAD